LSLPGPYAVACSNVVQDFTRLGIGEEVTDYWEGLPDGARTRYATDLLADPDNTLIATVTAPQDSTLFGSFAGQSLPFVVIVCYPTTADNPRPDYPLSPTDRFVPHMHIGSEAPLFADDAVLYPVLAYSHGYMGSPISSDDYMRALTVFASYGYVVVAPFHGDLRFSNLNLDNLDITAILALLNLNNFTAMQALRPLAISAALDLVLAHPQWSAHLDADKIGGFGASMGGETMLLLAGAGLTTSYFDVGASWRRVTADTRIKAAAGYIPYFGHVILPAFGRDYDGLAGITLPYLGISGTLDTTAPLIEARRGMLRLAGPRRLVALSGVDHGFDDVSTNDIFTWTLTFLDAYVRGDADAIARLSTMGSVAGGGDDSLLLY
ncbi:MAG: hypothetical protein R6W75_04345, partial [Smithellaceae bacterium]